MRTWLVAIGCISMLGQVLLLREVSVACFGVELVLVLALGVWMAGTALGALAVRGEKRIHERDVRLAFVLLGVLLLGAVFFLRGSRHIFHAVPGAYLGLGTQLLALAAGLVPVSATLGVLFIRSARRFAAAHGSLARAYALECAGGLLGGLASTLLLAAGVQNFHAVLLCSALAGAAAAWPLRRASAASTAGAALAVAMLVVAWFAAARLDRWTTTWNHPRLVASRDTPYARVTLSEAAGQVAVFEDDALVAESQSTTAEAFVHVAAVQRDSVRAVLALGGCGPGLLPEILAHRPVRVDDFEADARSLAVLAAHAGAPLQRAAADARVHVQIGDPRRLLQQAPAYDLVLVGMPEPASGRANRYYTVEFFTLAARHLTPDGVLALRLRGSENMLTPQLLRQLASVHAALRAVFPSVVVVPGSINVLLASKAPLTRAPEILARRLQARALQPRLVTPAYLRYLYTNDRFSALTSALQSTASVANTDVRPACYQTTMLLWLARFFPQLARVEVPGGSAPALLRTPWTWAKFALLGLLLVLARRRPVWRAAAFAAIAAGAGMILEAVLLLRYQSQTGILYQDIGLLLTAFMLGLAAGAELIHRWSAARPTATLLGRRAGLGVALGLAGIALITAGLVHVPAAAGLAAACALLACTGGGVGAAFAIATARARVRAHDIVSPVYAADLLGGGAGSLVAALWLAPSLGLDGAALAAALTSALALLCS